MILLKNKKTFIRILFYLIGRINVSKYFKIFPPYFYCISILFPFHTNAQSIDELLQIAASENPGLKALEKEYLAALEKAPQVSQLPDPELGVGVFPLPVETRLGAQIVRVGATQMLPWPGTLDGRADLETTKAKAMYKSESPCNRSRYFLT
ncbi:MAG: hypothetical protein R2788_12665 [Saprospiraceae bacterium]